VLYGNSTLYCFFRLHHLLVQRLVKAKELCHRASAVEQAAGGSSSSPSNTPTVWISGATSINSDSKNGVIDSKGSGVQEVGTEKSSSINGGSSKSKNSKKSEKVSAALLKPVVGVDSKGGVCPTWAGQEISEGTGSNGSSSSQPAEIAYRNFLTAVYGVLDGALDSSRFESECGDLMGSNAYQLYTIDKIASATAKSLVSLSSEPTAVRLIAAWDTCFKSVQAAFGEKGASASKTASLISSAFSAYKASVPSNLASKVNCWEECYVIQYVPEPSPTPASRVSAPIQLARESASLSVRYLGRPLPPTPSTSATSQPAAITASEKGDGREFEYSLSLPSFISRISGTYCPSAIIPTTAISSLLTSNNSQTQPKRGGKQQHQQVSSSGEGESPKLSSHSFSQGGSSAKSFSVEVMILGEELPFVEQSPPPEKHEVDPWMADE